MSANGYILLFERNRQYITTSRPDSCRPLISPSQPAGNDGFDNENGDLIVRTGQPIVDPETGREFMPRMHLGAGEFGHVYKVLSQGKSYAMKVSRNEPSAHEQFQAETEILEVISNPQVQEHFPAGYFDTLIKFECAFVYHGHICVVTEALGPSLMKIIQERKYSGVGLDLVQSVLRDVLRAVNTMAKMKIVHTDVKPENILQINIMSQHVKLIDLGNARLIEEQFNGYAQSRFYRAPEVILRLPIETASDIWSVGCLAAELMLGLPLLPGQDEVHQFWLITQMFGSVPDFMIEASPVRKRYFHDDGTMKTEDELCQGMTYESFSELRSYFKHSQLEEIVMSYGIREGASPQFVEEEMEHRKLFVSLLNKMLNVNPRLRITAEEALEEPFMHIPFAD